MDGIWRLHVGISIWLVNHLTSRGRRIKFPLLRRYNFPAARGR